jgi:hypothetical protein
MNHFACGYCGVEQFVERRGGTVALKAVTGAIEKVRVGTDKTAAELAIRRLKEESQQLGILYRQRLTRANSQKSDIPPAALGIAAITFVFAFIATAIINSIDYGLGFLAGGGLLILGAIACYYAKRDRDKEIDEKLQEDLSELIRHGNEINKRIAKNKEIVDS